MRTEEEIRAEVRRLEARAQAYKDRGRIESAADAESDAAQLRWALGETD